MELDSEIQTTEIKEKKKNIHEYFCLQKDETAVKADSELIWLDWVAIIKPKDKEILPSSSISKERKICL